MDRQVNGDRPETRESNSGRRGAVPKLIGYNETMETLPTPTTANLATEMTEVVDWTKLSLVPADVKELLQGVAKVMPLTFTGMSRFQIQHLLLNDVEYPTPAAKYWQCTRELWVRMQNIVHQEFSYKRALLRLEELEAKLKLTASKNYDTRSVSLDVQEAQFNIVCMRKQMLETVRETRAFYDAMMEIERNADATTRELLKDWELGEKLKWYKKGLVDEQGNRRPESVG